ncbi:MAG: hypothetical protein MRJ68_08445 [Nitrospira sp.]|nr:hypothetical protein [Nitrospira sp.]
MVTSRTSSKIVWLVATFSSTMLFVWEFEKQMGFQTNGLKWVVINAIIASLVVVGFWIFLYHAIWGFAKFLKVEGNEPIILVVGAYKDTREWASEKPKEEKERYFKQKANDKVHLEGAHGYLTGLETTRMISQFVYKLRDLTSRKLLVVRDDETPSDAGPLVCFGSSRSNFQSEVFLPSFVKFPDATSLSVTNKIAHTVYSSDENKDYAIVARYKVGSRWAFVCAGIDEEGTIAAGHYLLERWKCLDKFGGSFVQIICCHKSAPDSPEQIQAFVPGQHGDWVFDDRN